MRSFKILLGMTAIAACLIIGIECAQDDYLGGGYVASYDRSMSMDEGIAGMVQWLDAPVPSFPWYSADITFYKKGVPSATFSPYREYYATKGATVTGGIVSNPSLFDITKQSPSSIFYGTGQGLPYSQYVSIQPSNTNDLWIQGATNWTQYLVSPVGAAFQLVANVPLGGPGGFYEVIQTETTAAKYKTYQFYEGHNAMSYTASQIGRHMLYFVVNNQPSNVVIIDVFSQSPTALQSSYISTTTTQTASSMPPTNVAGGDTPVKIQSGGMRGYQVYLDENYIGTEGTGGDVPDGIFSFQVAGNQNHNIRVFDGQFNYPKSMFFDRGVLKIIYVEPGTAVYN
jgi:hypothetical protein